MLLLKYPYGGELSREQPPSWTFARVRLGRVETSKTQYVMNVLS